MFILRSLVVLEAFFACVSDLKSGKVRNEIVLIGAAMGVLLHLRWVGIYGLPACLAGGLMALVPGYLLFRYRMIGAGDIKLLTAIGCILGVNYSIRFLILALFCAGAETCILLAINGNLNERLIYLKTWCHRRFAEGEAVPYRRAEGSENFHMTVPILIAAILFAGGVR